ncbi:MAG: hypothetical protein F4Y57_05430 [Acidobacteria bacterium]|nr:hypothetical protein [Acidobacteriota bacterium]
MQVFTTLRAFAVLVALLAAAGVTVGVGGVQDGGPPRETIVYSTIQPSNWDLFLFESPGAKPRRLTTDPGLDYNGAFSPDGRWVVFTSERSGSPDLYVLDLRTGATARPLVTGPAMEDAADISPDGSQLLFVSTRSGNADIFVMPFRPEDPAAAGEAKNLTRHAAGDYNPAFSPDGTRILFSSSRDTAVASSTGPAPTPTYLASELYVMQADGTDVRRLTRHESWDGAPAWTPDGQAAVFYSQRDGEPRIYRTAIDGSGAEPVSAGGEAALSPTFGPDGRLAFTVRRDDRWTLVTAGPDGADLRIASDTGRDYWAPEYDPASGRLLAHGPGPLEPASRFESDSPGAFPVHASVPVDLPDRRVSLIGIRGYIPAIDRTSGEVATSEAFARLVVSRADGSRKRVLVDRAEADRYRGPDSAWGPSWSYDGGWLAFAVGPPFASAARDVDIWKIRSDGSGAVNLTPDSDTNEAFPDFAPDGRRIVFRSLRDGNGEIYVMDADGTGVRRLTHHEATDTMPAFSSGGDRVAFTSFRDGNFEIYTIAFDRNGEPGPPERLTRNPGNDMHPKFSPDDEWVLFTSQRSEFSDELPLLRVIFQPQPYGELHAIRLADRTVVRLTHNKWEDGPTAWVRDVPGLD